MGRIDVVSIAHLNFDHRRRRIVLPADVLPGNDREADVGRVEAILAFAGRKEPLVEDVARVPGHRRTQDITLKGKATPVNCASHFDAINSA